MIKIWKIDIAFYLKILEIWKIKNLQIKSWGIFKRAWTAVFKPVTGKYGSLNIISKWGNKFFSKYTKNRRFF